MEIWEKSSELLLAKDSEDKVDELVLQFDNNEVTYKRNEWNKIRYRIVVRFIKRKVEFRMLLPMVIISIAECCNEICCIQQ